ncbi:MAG: hypothetical protein AAF636_11580 [Pseudomonadota bacterium]
MTFDPFRDGGAIPLEKSSDAGGFDPFKDSGAIELDDSGRMPLPELSQDAINADFTVSADGTIVAKDQPAWKPGKANRDSRRPDPSVKIPEFEPPSETEIAQVAEAYNALKQNARATEIRALADKAETPKGFFEALGDVLDEGLPVPFAGNLDAIQEAYDLTQLAEKVKARPDDEDLNFELYRRLNDQMRERTVGGQVVEILGMLPQFMSDLGAGGGLFNLGRTGTQAGLRTAAQKALSDQTFNRVRSNLLTKALEKSTSTVAGVTASMPVSGTGLTLENYFNEMMPELEVRGDTIEDFQIAVGDSPESGEAARRAIADSYIELLSERVGGAIPFLARPLRERAAKTAFGRAAMKLNPTLKSEELGRLLDTVGWNGVLGEVFEERAGDVMRDVAGLEEFRWPDADQLLAEFIAFSVPAGGFYAADRVLRPTLTPNEQASEKATPQAAAPEPNQTQPQTIAEKRIQALNTEIADLEARGGENYDDLTNKEYARLKMARQMREEMQDFESVPAARSESVTTPTNEDLASAMQEQLSPEGQERVRTQVEQASQDKQEENISRYLNEPQSDRQQRLVRRRGLIRQLGNTPIYKWTDQQVSELAELGYVRARREQVRRDQDDYARRLDKQVAAEKQKRLSKENFAELPRKDLEFLADRGDEAAMDQLIQLNQQEEYESQFDPKEELLEAIKAVGGLPHPAELLKRGVNEPLVAELEMLYESTGQVRQQKSKKGKLIERRVQPRGLWNRKAPGKLDQIREQLQADYGFSWLLTPDDLINAVDERVRDGKKIFPDWAMGQSGDLKDGINFSRAGAVAETKPAQMTARAVEQAVMPTREAWKGSGVRINVVNTTSDLPPRYRRIIEEQGDSAIEGFYDKSTKTSWLIASALESPAQARSVLFHEVIGHHGMREILGDTYEDFMQSVWRRAKDRPEMSAIVEDYMLDPENPIDQIEAAEEYIAQIAEGDVTDPGLWRRILSLVRDWLRKHGIDVGEVSEKDIRAALTRARRNLERPRKDGETNESFDGEPAIAMSYRHKNGATREDGSLESRKSEAQPANAEVKHDRLTDRGAESQMREQTPYEFLSSEHLDKIKMLAPAESYKMYSGGRLIGSLGEQAEKDTIVYRGEDSPPKIVRLVKGAIGDSSSKSASIYPTVEFEMSNGSSLKKTIRISDHDQVSAFAPRQYELDYRGRNWTAVKDVVRADLQEVVNELWAAQRDLYRELTDPEFAQTQKVQVKKESYEKIQREIEYLEKQIQTWENAIESRKQKLASQQERGLVQKAEWTNGKIRHFEKSIENNRAKISALKASPRSPVSFSRKRFNRDLERLQEKADELTAEIEAAKKAGRKPSSDILGRRAELRSEIEDRMAELQSTVEGLDANGEPVETADQAAPKNNANTEIEAATHAKETEAAHVLRQLSRVFQGFKSSLPELPNFGKWQNKPVQFFQKFREGYRRIVAATDMVRKQAEEDVAHVLEPLTELGREQIDPNTVEKWRKLVKQRTRRREARAATGFLDQQIKAIEDQLGDNPFYLFQNAVIYRDLWYRSLMHNKDGKPLQLPGGLSAEQVRRRLGELHALIAQHEQADAISETLKRHYTLVEGLQKDLLDHGQIIPEDLRNPLYFPHHVLENFSGKLGNVEAVTAPAFRSYLLEPVGSVKVVEADYLKAIYHHVAQVRAHNTQQDLVEQYWQPYDAAAKVQADLENEAAESSGYVHAEAWKNPDNWPAGYELYTVDDQLPLRMEYVIDRDLLALELGVALGDGDLRERMKELGVEMDLKPEMLQAALTAGSKTQWLLPSPVVESLRGLKKRGDSKRSRAALSPGGISRAFMRGWKYRILFAPWNYVRYEFNNSLADTEKIFAIEPRLFAELPAAARELMDFWKGGEPSVELREAFKRGVIDSVTVQEAGELKKFEQFTEFLTSGEQTVEKLKKLATWTTDIARLRESTVRYAKFKADVERIRGGATPVYGGAYWKDVEAREGLYAKAAYISQRTFGDYSDLSVTGQWMREHMVPFYSWMEINFRYHANLFRNLSDMLQAGKWGTAKDMAGITARASVATATGIMARLALPYLAIQMWNNFGGSLMGLWDEDDDLESQLSEHDRRRLHIILGKDANGKIMLVHTPTALSDIMEWFGGNKLGNLFTDYAAQRITLDQVFKDYFKAIGPDLLNKVVQGVRPDLKAPYMAMSRKNPFPDITDQRTISKHDMPWAILSTMTDHSTAWALRNLLDEEHYSSKSTLDWAQQAILQIRRRDPEQWAYYEIREKTAQWLEEKTGKIKGGFDYTSPDQQAIRNFRKAIYNADIPAAIRFYNLLLDYGYTAERFQSSVRSQDPLTGLSKEARRQWYAELSQHERQQLELAMSYYGRMAQSKGKEKLLFPRKTQTESSYFPPRYSELINLMTESMLKTDAEKKAFAEQLLQRSLD